MKNVSQKITTFLMFSGNAEEAMNFYTSIFDDSEILSITRYGANQAGREGTVVHAKFTLMGQEFMCIDSNIEHPFTFTPAISLYITCENEAEINQIYEGLSQDGKILMPLAAYPFSEKYCWIQDKYGITWQLNLNII